MELLANICGWLKWLWSSIKKIFSIKLKEPNNQIPQSKPLTLEEWSKFVKENGKRVAEMSEYIQCMEKSIEAEKQRKKAFDDYYAD